MTTKVSITAKCIGRIIYSLSIIVTLLCSPHSATLVKVSWTTASAAASSCGKIDVALYQDTAHDDGPEQVHQVA